MAESQMTGRESGRTGNDFGSLGWFSASGFIIMGLLYLLDTMEIASSILSPMWTLIVAVVAGIGSLLFYFGNDPTAKHD